MHVAAVDVGECVTEIVGSGGGGENLSAGADLHGRKRRAVRTNFLMLQPVWVSIHWETARAANTMVRWASIDSRL